MKKILMSSAIALIVVSCGGGSGGGSSSSSGGGNETSTPKTLERSSDSGEITVETGQYTNDRGEQKEYKSAFNFKTPDGKQASVQSTFSKTISYNRTDPNTGAVTVVYKDIFKQLLYVDGQAVSPTEAAFSNVVTPDGLMRGLYANYNDENDKPVALSGYYVDDALKPFLSAHDTATSYSYTGVDYKYNRGAGSSKNDFSGTDGKVSYSAGTGKWQGNFGDVKLDGKLEGINVKGQATLDDMKGAFSGIDAKADYALGATNFIQNQTVGGFSGSNGDDGAFAGSWGHVEDR